MTEQLRRPRGRPKGSEIDDRKALSQIADLLVEGRAHNVASATRRLAGHDPSLIRRLQRKFRLDRERLLAEAAASAQKLALQEGLRQDQIMRATRPLDWRQTHDPATQLMDAINLERQDSLTKSFAGRRRTPPQERSKAPR